MTHRVYPHRYTVCKSFLLKNLTSKKILFRNVKRQIVCRSNGQSCLSFIGGSLNVVRFYFILVSTVLSYYPINERQASYDFPGRNIRLSCRGRCSRKNVEPRSYSIEVSSFTSDKRPFESSIGNIAGASNYPFHRCSLSTFDTR